MNNITEKCSIVNSITLLRRIYFFQRLRDSKNDKDLSPKDISDILKISQTVYSRHKRDYQNIPIAHLLTLADFYNISIDYLLGRTNNSSRY